MIERRAIEIRLSEDPSRSGPGLLQGTILRYGEIAGDRPERFTDGALHWPEGGVVLREQHSRSNPIVRLTPTVEGREVRVSVALPDTQRGRDAAVSVRNGTLTGLSIEFIAESEGMVSGIREIRRASLHGVGLVDDPSYTSSLVSVRQGNEQGNEQDLLRLI